MKIFEITEKIDLSNLKSFLYKEDELKLITITVNKQQVIFSATDNTKGLKKYFDEAINIHNELDNPINVDGNALIKILKVLTPPIMFEKINDEIIIKSGKSRFQLSLSTQELMPFPKYDNHILITLKDTEKIVNNMQKALKSVLKNNPIYGLTGVLIKSVKNGIDIVGTDTKRLTLISLDEDVKKDIKAIIPFEVVKEISKINKPEIISLTDEHIFIIGDSSLMFSSLISYDYPDYNRIVPSDVKEEIVVNKQKIIDCLKTIKIVANQDNNAIKLEISNKTIKMTNIKTNLSSETGEVILEDENISLKNNKTIEFGINLEFFLDAVNIIEDDLIKINFNNKELPLNILSCNEDKIQTIVMPIVY